MDARTRELIQQGSILRGLLVWVFGRPDNRLVTPVDRIVSVVSRLTMFLTVIVVAITFYEVVMRYLFQSPTLWVNELTLWLGSVIFLMAGAYTMQRRAHIRITAVYDIVPRTVRLVFDIVAVLVVVAYAAMMIWAGFDVAFDTLMRWERFGTFWNPPIPATVKPWCSSSPSWWRSRRSTTCWPTGSTSARAATTAGATRGVTIKWTSAPSR